ncbi:hypothetical protein QC823_12905 [Halomonas vilamensis]|uniref:Uncharacterized protein n=1 Tax=Vreelandella vilamensis TaxID=531309 RepID=A0ABU1H6F7_9GAMM|nr:hypothetical protein [Halomonas vilamensis]MDR5899887.1 hypothetical protein [Halomonas vilamensis]
MTFYGALTILMYAIAPYAWWLVAGAVFLVILHIVAYLRGYQITHYRCNGALIVSGLVGLSAIAWIPMMTNSQLSYIATASDWVALISGVVGIFILAYLLLHPASYLVREKT